MGGGICYQHCFVLPSEIELIEPEAWNLQLNGSGTDSVLRMKVQAGREPVKPEPIEPIRREAIERAAARLWDVADRMTVLPEHEDFRHQISFLIALSYSIHDYAESHRLAPFTFPTPKFWKATIQDRSPSDTRKSIKYTVL